MESRSKRRLAAILAADVVGYSRLVGEDEEGTISALQLIRADVIEPLVTRFDGRIANTAGDSFLIEFPSAVDAARAAIEIQSGVKKWNNAAESDHAIALRIGLNVGDVVSVGDDILGDGVNVAARLEALAEPGGIVASLAFVNYVRSKVAAEFTPMGLQQVKNIAEPVDAFRIENGQSESTTMPQRRGRRVWAVVAALTVLAVALGGVFWAAPWDRSSARASLTRLAYPLPDLPSIAVLPFTNFSGENANAMLVDGITEDLITDLSRISGLFVIAGNTSFAYREQDIQIARFAEELGVRYVVDGSVRRAGSAFRVNLRLTDTANGQLLWAERYDGEIDELFAVQNRFTLEIANALNLTVEPQEQRDIKKIETQTIDAREAFQRGWELYARFNERDNLAAIPHFVKAVDLDPEYGRAWAALALAHLRPHLFHHWSGGTGDGDQLHISLFYKNLQEASRHETSLIHVIRAMVRLNLRDWVSVGDERRGTDEARLEAAKAIAMQPSDPEAHLTMGWALIAAGEPEEGLRFVESAMRLDPNHPSHYVLFQAAAFLAIDDLETATEVLLAELERNPEAKELMPVAASVLAQSGDLLAARGLVDRWQDKNDQGILDVAVRRYFFVVRWVGEHQHLNRRLTDGLRLAALPRGTTVASLRADLSRGDAMNQRAAARALALFGPEAASAVPELISALESASVFVRRDAAIALGRIGAAAAPALPALEVNVDETVAGRFATQAIDQIRAASTD